MISKDKDNEEDAALWRNVLKTVRAYPATPAAKPVPKSTRKPPAQPKKAHAVAPAAAAPKKKRYERRVDLHGMTQAQAHRRLNSFIEDACAEKLSAVLVITGKGGAAGTGVLRRMLPLWAEAPPLKGMIAAITPAGQEDGGSGAYIVRLKK
jgi:DNA-nicking Smr family endonuclease